MHEHGNQRRELGAPLGEAREGQVHGRIGGAVARTCARRGVELGPRLRVVIDRRGDRCGVARRRRLARGLERRCERAVRVVVPHAAKPGPGFATDDHVVAAPRPHDRERGDESDEDRGATRPSRELAHRISRDCGE